MSISPEQEASQTTGEYDLQTALFQFSCTRLTIANQNMTGTTNYSWEKTISKVYLSQRMTNINYIRD